MTRAPTGPAPASRPRPARRDTAGLVVALAALTALAAGASSARAAPGPGYQWRTLETRLCDVHFHLEVEAEARRIAAICDESVEVSTAILRSAPREKTQVVVIDTDDRANGFTRNVPQNLVTILTIAPDGRSDLAATEDHLRLVLVHEMFHIVHLETYSGLPEWVNRALGKSWPPNLLQPRFVVEGLAVLAESRVTDGGRLRSERFKAPLRVAAREGDLWSLDDLATASRRPPSGNAAYLYGGAFMGFLAERHGEALFAEHARELGGHVVPFAIQRAFREVGGVDLSVEYEAFRADLVDETRALEARIAARGGPPPTRRLTRVGGAVSTPRFDSSGTLYFVADPPNGVAGIWRIEGLPAAIPVPSPVIQALSPSGVAPLDDGRVALTRADTLDGVLPFQDLFVVDADRTMRAVTRAARVRDPWVMPGRDAVVVERRTGHVAAVTVVELDTGAQRDLVRYDDGTQVYTPRPAPDGRTVVFSRLAPGGRRTLVEVDVATGALTELIPSAAEDCDPAFTPDGRYLLFSSSREGGIFNVHALERATGQVLRLTDTVGAASQPIASPDGRAVVYVDVTLAGSDLFAIPFRPDDAAESARAPPAPAVRAPPSDDREASIYNPLPSLLPRAWFPTFDVDQLGGAAYGLVLAGEDAVGLFAWSLQASYGTMQRRPRVSGSLRLDGAFIPVTMSASLLTDDTLIRADRGIDVPRRQTVIRAGVEASAPLRRFVRSHGFSVGYSRAFYFDEGAPYGSPDGASPKLPPPAHIGSLSMTWSYSDVRRLRDSISPELGQTAFVRVEGANALTFSPLNLYEITFGGRVYRPVPFFARHVVSLVVEGGFAQGERLRRTNFRLGGIEGRDLTRDLVSQVRFGDGILRGYPSAIDIGDAYYLATLEYRLPLFEVEQGVASAPLYLSRVQAAAFADVGDAFDGVPQTRGARASVGAELQLRLTVAYYGAFFVRMGYARGLMRSGTHQPYFVLGIPL